MGLDAISIRRARAEDAQLLAAAERVIAAVPGRLASRPDEIDEQAIRKLIVDHGAGDRGVLLVAESAGTLVGHAFLEPLSLAATAHVVRLTIAVHEGHRRRGIGRALMEDL